MFHPPKHITFLQERTIADVLAEKQDIHQLIEISINATVEEAFDLLLAENILSVPVYRIWKGHREPIALVSAFDLVTFVCLQTINNDEDDNEQLQDKSKFLKKSIGELIGLTPESTNLIIRHPSDNLLDLINLFTRHKVHRVLVTEQLPNDNEDIRSVINEDLVQPCFVSQTDVVRFLVNHNHQLGKILDVPASRVVSRASRLLPISAKRQQLLDRPSSITVQDQALTAFQKIYQDEVLAVAIVDDETSLIGEISAADLRGLNCSRLNDLKMPVIMFLEICKKGLMKPLSCRAGYTLSQIMSGLIIFKAHRSWMVDENDSPIGVITLSDILSMFLPESVDLSYC